MIVRYESGWTPNKRDSQAMMICEAEILKALSAAVTPKSTSQRVKSRQRWYAANNKILVTSSQVDAVQRKQSSRVSKEAAREHE